MWTFYTAFILSITQVQQSWASGCSIVSVTSPSASTLNVEWTSDAGASVYMLDLRVVNSTSIASVVVMQAATSAQRLVVGLRPGHLYEITLKVFRFYVEVCSDTTTAMTVPAASQFTLAEAISSTSIRFEWTEETGADSYILEIEKLFTTPAWSYNQTFTTLQAQVDNLLPSTTYSCSLYSSNSAGRGQSSSIRTILTLVEPPSTVNVVMTARSTARVSWTPVDSVLLYQVKVTDIDNPNNPSVISSTGDTFMDISDLEPCSTYTVGVSSMNMFLVPGEALNDSVTTSTINPVTTVSADYSCTTGRATVSWDLVFGANTYRAVAVDRSGTERHCNSSTSSCQVSSLSCGEVYTVTVTAISDDCESGSNISTTFETVPCAPNNPQAYHECFSNVIIFSWEPTNNTFYYVATATDNNGVVVECRTIGTSCYFTSTECGQFYKYDVYAVSTGCNSEISQPEFIRTSPCLPTNIKTSDDCSPEKLVTTWDPAVGAQYYMVELHGNLGDIYNCSTSSTNCTVSGIPCGEHLSVWITASNDNCSTHRVLGHIAHTIPCTPANVSIIADCSQDSAVVNWTTSYGSVMYTAVSQDLDGNIYSCQGMDTNCRMEGLRCGQNYTSTVMGSNFFCNSTESHPISFSTASCGPSSIEAIRDCDQNNAQIIWQDHQDTGNYTAVIEDQTGATLNCTSNTVNSCLINSLPCGRRYNVSVKYDDGKCQSNSQTIGMDSVPCGPENVQTSMECNSGDLTLSWNISAPADNYTATVMSGAAGLMHCNSTSTHCTIGGLDCGSLYTVKVTSITGACQSLPSPEVNVRTYPCPPTEVRAEYKCAPQSVPVWWAASNHSMYYVAEAVSSSGHSSQCTTNQTSCSFSGLHCGDVYNVTVVGADDDCTGPQSDTITLYTEPCAPVNVSSQVHCASRTADVSWAPSLNAQSYSIQANSVGHTLSCNSSSPNCTLTGLQCGLAYDIVVSATDGRCLSTYSASFRQEPIPCTHVTMNTSLCCESNNLTVSWNSSDSGSSNLMATAVSAAGEQLTCRSYSSSCVISGLQCGQTYNVSLTAPSGGCGFSNGTYETVQTAPCPPQAVQALTNCASDSLYASWNSSLGAMSYTATLTGPNGVTDTCSSANLTCSFTGLQCATRYNVSVTSQDGRCTSAPTQVVMTTRPCDSTNVTAVLQCGSNTAMVSWEAAAPGVIHNVIAQEHGSQQQTSCRSNSTSCQLHQLQCGTMYNLTIRAEDTLCNSSVGTTAVLMTAPCSPSIQSTSLICGTDVSTVSWLPVADATGYTVNATGTAGHSASCHSPAASCNLTDLLCAENYTVTITAHGDQCDSAPGQSSVITTTPCPPLITMKQYDCGNNTVELSWTNNSGGIGYVAELSGQGYSNFVNTANPNCLIHNLPCGLDLNITVQALGPQCNSPLSSAETLKTVPCSPQKVNATLTCSNHSALVTWEGNPSDVLYQAVATSEDGHTHHCHTNATSCQISNILCGETYNISITPYSDSCTGSPSAAYSFQAGQCPPQNVSVNQTCNEVTVSWANVPGADSYIATATAADGHSYTCSSNLTGCQISELRSGETYNVTVVTMDRGCRSEPSGGVEVTTAVCATSNLTGEFNCDTDTVTLQWDPSQGSGVSYIIKTEIIGGILPPYENTTTNTSYTMTDLICGQRYSFKLATDNGYGSTHYSSPLILTTAPCQPTNFTARVDCGTNRGNFSWVESLGAGFYTVQVTGEHGHVASCTSNDSSCSVKLHCGRLYSATLLASTESCNSTKHTDIQFESAPCLPDDIDAVLDCETNAMNVSWTQTPGTDSYTAWAIGADGNRTSCSTSSNSCLIQDLQCGRTYEVAVTSSSINCDLIAGSDYKVQTAPCKPENTTVEQNCSSNTLTVTWKQMSKSQNYSVTAASATGVNSTCSTTENFCDFPNLSCDELYTFTVMAHSNVCMSEMSTVQKQTGPCPPTDVSTSMNCTSREALVSWSSAAAASSYRVQATSVYGHNVSYSAMGTSCPLENLMCGQEYTVSVEAISTGCPGPASTPVSLITGPCPPMNLSVHYNVSHSYATWSASSGADYYSVYSSTYLGLDMKCNTSATRCSLSGLSCGQSYNITVTAHNLVCDSATSDSTQVTTEPCPPSNVQASLVCGEDISANVSWEQSPQAVGYVAYVDDQNGYISLCSAADTESSCVASGLTCGKEYDVWVQALGQEYNSSNSAATSVTTGPCPPTAIATVIDCETNSATVSWQPAVGADSYFSEIVSSSGHTSYCHNNQSTNCQLTSLPCGEDYNVTVKSVGQTCNSTRQMAQFSSEPCPPSHLFVGYNTSHARVQWSATNGARAYVVEAVTMQGLTSTCNSTSTSCLLTGLQCGQMYNITVKTHSGACNNTSSSDPHQLTTEPCPPANVVVDMACESQTASVSWELSNHAVGYVAYFDGPNGECTTCVADDSETSCEVNGLKCGEEYAVRVKARGQHHNSSDSTVATLVTAPCVPTHIDVDVDCHSDSDAVVSWNATDGTANFSLTTSTSAQALCVTQQNSCNITGLSCGENHNLSLTVSNQQCSLTVPLQTNLTTRPCPPQSVAVDFQCGSSTALVSWEHKSEVELYTATAVQTPGGNVQICDSLGSYCQFSGLSCGETYNVTVTAQSQGCHSRESSTVILQTEPCPPANVSAQAACQSEDIQISWQPASGVENYFIRARGNLGFVAFYNTTQATVSATLPCGQSYNITVEGESSVCNSLESSPYVVKAGPCAPSNVMTYVQCEVNTGSVTWGSSDGAQMYNVEATGLDGHVHQCVTNSTSCSWDDLHCGDQYTVVVRAEDENCTSPPSNSSVIHMAPCSSQNLVASVDCDMKVVALNWNSSAASAYLVTATNRNTTLGLTTNGTNAHFSEFQCGQMYNLTVTSQSQHCPGTSSASTSVLTWPCLPERVSTVQYCMSDIMVTWQASNGTDSYMATLNTDTGITETCMSDSDRCSVQGLTCGHNFSVSVTASNQQCNVTSGAIRHQSAPCAPTNVSVAMDCSNNTVLVTWNPSRGAVQYSVTASSQDVNISCLATTDHYCRLDNLTCGQVYRVQAVAMDDTCSSLPSQAATFTSAPCSPHNVTTDLDCSSNTMSVSWETIRDAEYFLVSVMGYNGGVIESHNTTRTECSVGNLTCGSTYHVKVTSHRGDCHSCSQTNSVTSAPCTPQNINGSLDCVTNSAWISWDAADGADSYTVSAVGGDHSVINCTTSTNTTCEVENLACGVSYNFTVVATNSKCHSPASSSISLETAPCTLSSITAVPQCHNSSILVVWQLMDGGDGDTVYTATAESSDHTFLTCNNTGTSCFMRGAECGKHYTVMVAADSDQCSSMRSPPYRISMEPCPPSGVQVDLSCEDQSAVVSWSTSAVAQTYHVEVMGVDGYTHSCNSTCNNCTVTGLHCDQHYSVSLTASHENCTSAASQSISFYTGPCQPEDLAVLFNCANQSAVMSWSARDNAVHYYGCAQTDDGEALYCESSTPNCTFEGLDCGTVYNFSVQASDGTCNSSFSDPVLSGAAPCPPADIEVELLPVVQEVQVLRFSWTRVECRDTQYLVEATGTLLGDSQAQFEISSYWTNASFFEIPLPCGSDYSAALRSRSGSATSDLSAALNGTTAPCAPVNVEYSGNSSFATVSWNASVFATSYTVYNGNISSSSQLCVTDGLSCSLSDINATKVVVTASNAAGESDGTAVTFVGILARRRRDLTGPMSKYGLTAPELEVIQTSATGVVLKWSDDEAGSPHTLVIRKQGSSTKAQEMTVYGGSIILSQLSPGSTYCFSVSAGSGDLSGPQSEPVCLQTGLEFSL